jgi:hypothetical protein
MAIVPFEFEAELLENWLAVMKNVTRKGAAIAKAAAL